MQGRLLAVMMTVMLSSTGLATAAQPKDGASIATTAQQDVARAHGALGKAEHSLGDALKDMSFMSPVVQSAEAEGDAYEAQNSTQRALALLPRGQEQATHASYDRSLERLQEAAQDDRVTMQALAELPASKARDAALDQTRQALIDTQDAMVDIAPQLSS